jgi:hypothetical protein
MRTTTGGAGSSLHNVSEVTLLCALLCFSCTLSQLICIFLSQLALYFFLFRISPVFPLITYLFIFSSDTYLPVALNGSD